MSVPVQAQTLIPIAAMASETTTILTARFLSATFSGLEGPIPVLVNRGQPRMYQSRPRAMPTAAAAKPRCQRSPSARYGVMRMPRNAPRLMPM